MITQAHKPTQGNLLILIIPLYKNARDTLNAMSLFEDFYVILSISIQVGIQILIHHFLLQQKQV